MPRVPYLWVAVRGQVVADRYNLQFYCQKIGLTWIGERFHETWRIIVVIKGNSQYTLLCYHGMCLFTDLLKGPRYILPVFLIPLFHPFLELLNSTRPLVEQ